MLVYHGSNCDIDTIDLSKGNRFKDFGQGFYVTPNIETAKRMAQKKTAIYGGIPMIITYEFDDSVLCSDKLHILEFPKRATVEWISFIDRNRNRRELVGHHGYDIVKGPIADDGVAIQLNRLRSHVDSPESIAIDLQDKFLDQQIYFGTTKALVYLKKISVCKLK